MTRAVQDMTDHEMAVCLGFDAMRILLGIRPKNFTTEQVIKAIRLCAKAKAKESDKEQS